MNHSLSRWAAAAFLVALALILAMLMLAAPQTALSANTPLSSSTVQVILGGTVSAVDGAPIPGATVTVSLLAKDRQYHPVATRTADASGRWSYGGKLGSYRCQFSAPSADAATLFLVCRAKGGYNADITLRTYGVIKGFVIAADTGKPLPNVVMGFHRKASASGDGIGLLSLSDFEQSPSATTVTDASGAFVSPPLPIGVYAVSATAPGYPQSFSGGADPTPFTVTTAGVIVTQDLPLEPEAPPFGSISGRIYGGGGTTGLHGYVYFYKQAQDGTYPRAATATTESASNGVYSSSELELGTYKVKLFTVHTGAQWYPSQPTSATATPIVLDTPGQAVTGIDAVF